MAHHLVPEFYPSAPPWHGRLTEGEYKGRRDWWADYKYHDPSVKTGRWRLQRPRFEAEDRWWFDPPVKDGTSLSGAYGNDAHWTPRADKKVHDQHTLPIREWQERIYKNSVQIKDIESKFKLSPEHPGMKFYPDLSGSSAYGAKQVLGTHDVSLGNTFMEFTLNPFSLFRPLRQQGPMFFSSPINQDCHVKAAAMVKYAAMWQLIVALNLTVNLDGHRFVSSAMLRSLRNRFFYGLPYPCALGATLGATVCIASMVREKDDVINVWIAAASTAGSLASAARWGVPLMVIGTFWQAGRTNEHGFSGIQLHKGAGGPTPPLQYQTTGFERIAPFDNANQKYF